MAEHCDRVLAIDPGRAKCGVAVVRGGQSHTVLHQATVASTDLPEAVTQLAQQFAPDAVIVGDGTTSDAAMSAVRGATGREAEVVDEEFTSLLARKRYFKENPPRGLRRLIPISLQTPPRPIDDYVAVILAERYLIDHK